MKRIIIPQSLIPALRDGRKTQHRVPLKRQPPDGETVAYGMYHPTLVRKDGEEYPGPATFGCWTPDGDWALPCPFRVGEELWVAETHWWCPIPHAGNLIHTAFKSATDIGCSDGMGWLVPAEHQAAAAKDVGHWRSPATMPRWAARFVLTITDVRVERVQDIRAGDVEAEGISFAHMLPSIVPPGANLNAIANVVARTAYSKFYDATHGPGAWTRNDFCWVPTFTVRKMPGGGR